MNLYELTEQFRSLLELAENEDIPEDVFEDTLEALDGEIDEQFDGLCSVIKELDMQALGTKAESDRLAVRAKSKAARRDRLKNYLSDMMKKVGRDKFENNHHNVRFNKSSKLVFTDPEQLFDWLSEHYPDKVTVKTERCADKNELKRLAKTGVVIPFTETEISMNISVK